MYLFQLALIIATEMQCEDMSDKKIVVTEEAQI